MKSYYSPNITAHTQAGIKHTAINQKNEDAFACFENGDFRIAVLADGCSSGNLAKIGAETTANATIEFARQVCPASLFYKDRRRTDELIEKLLLHVRRKLLECAKCIPIEEFASTLLVAFLWRKRFFTVQIGDGGIVLANDGKFKLLQTKSPTEMQTNITYSTYDLCTLESFAWKNIYTVHRGVVNRNVLLMSDGVLNALNKRGLDTETLDTLTKIQLYCADQRLFSLRELCKAATAYTHDDTTVIVMNASRNPMNSFSLEEKQSFLGVIAPKRVHGFRLLQEYLSIYELCHEAVTLEHICKTLSIREVDALARIKTMRNAGILSKQKMSVSKLIFYIQSKNR